MEDKIATNICKVAEFDKSIFFKAICSCMSHDTTMIIEYDDGIIQQQMFSKINLGQWYNWKWWQVPYKRLMVALKVLFKGDIEMEGEFYFIGENQVKDYIIALQSGLEKVTKWQQDFEAEKAKEKREEAVLDELLPKPPPLRKIVEGKEIK